MSWYYKEAERLDSEKFYELFLELVEFVRTKKLSFKDDVEEKSDHFIVTEEDRGGCYFVHLVPKGLYHKFRGVQIVNPIKMIDDYVVCGRKDGKEIRVACFGMNLKVKDNGL